MQTPAVLYRGYSKFSPCPISGGPSSLNVAGFISPDAEIGLHVPACFLRLYNNCICLEHLEPPRTLHRVSRSPYFDPGAFQLPHPTLLRWIPEEDRERDVLRYGDLDMGFRRCRTEAGRRGTEGRKAAYESIEFIRHMQ
jgi:hypothetical protein